MYILDNELTTRQRRWLISQLFLSSDRERTQTRNPISPMLNYNLQYSYMIHDNNMFWRKCKSIKWTLQHAWFAVCNTVNASWWYWWYMIYLYMKEASCPEKSLFFRHLIVWNIQVSIPLHFSLLHLACHF